MARKYTKIELLSDEIFRLKEHGKTHREIGDLYGPIKGSLSNVVEKYYRKNSGCLCSSALPCFVIEHIEDATTEVFKVPKSVAHTL